MTNGDKIRQMSNEELLDWMCEHIVCVHPEQRCPRVIQSCYDCRKAWILAEALKSMEV